MTETLGTSNSFTMSLLTEEGHISTKPCAFVPAILNLPGIKRAPPSVSNVSSRSSFQGPDSGVDLTEGCMLTKSVKYAHQISQFISAIHKGDPDPVEDAIEELYIVPYANFFLTDPCNHAYLESFVHTSLNVYGFIAFTASLPTLDGLIQMVKYDNDARQAEADTNGDAVRRFFDFSNPAFTNPEYELVALYPDHFLPAGSVLTIYHPQGAYTNYMVSSDQFLRQTTESRSPRLPPFSHGRQQRVLHNRLNVFLVILNAEIKFRRYRKEILLNKFPNPPQDILELMNRTLELVDLIYWTPVPAKGSPGEVILDQQIAFSRELRAARAARFDTGNTIERAFNVSGEMGEVLRGTHASQRKWFRGASGEQRRAYMTMLMTPADEDYCNPALLPELKRKPVANFEEAPPDTGKADSVSEHASGSSSHHSHHSTDTPSNCSRLQSLSRFLWPARYSNIIKKS